MTGVLGFTGTGKGMTLQQYSTVVAMLKGELAWISEAHHGDCVGADKDFDSIAATYGLHIVAHPGTDKHGQSPKRAWCPDPEIRDPRPYLARNRDIVTEATVLLACPKGPETPRGGTWHTIRQARQLSVPIIIVWPDGSVGYEPQGGS